MEDSKQFWKSKTFWASLVTAVLPVFPPVAVLIAANPEAYSAVLGAVFGALRITTVAPLSVKKK